MMKGAGMNSPAYQTPSSSAADENAIRAIHQQMIDAWNTGNGSAFAAQFSDDADFVVFEGTHLKGRHQIATFTQQIFDTVMKGSRLEGEVNFVRFLSPDLAVMHSVVRTILPGQAEASPSRDSMEMYVVKKRDGSWQTEEILNARRLTLERQLFWDDFDALTTEAQREVTDVVAYLKDQ